MKTFKTCLVLGLFLTASLALAEKPLKPWAKMKAGVYTTQGTQYCGYELTVLPKRGTIVLTATDNPRDKSKCDGAGDSMELTCYTDHCTHRLNSWTEYRIDKLSNGSFLGYVLHSWRDGGTTKKNVLKWDHFASLGCKK